MYMEDVSIIIPHVIDWEMTKRCVDSCLANGKSKAIYILDNSKDGIEDFDYPDDRIVYVYRIYDTENDIPRSCASAWNMGLSLTGSKYVIILNSDTEVPASFDFIMRQEIEYFKDCVCLSVPEIHPDNWKHTTDFSKLDNGKFSEGLNGPCFMVDRNYVFEIGGFDQRFTPSCYEDVDFFKRLVEDGKKAIVTGRTCVMHHGAYTRNSEEMLKIDADQNGCYHIVANKRRFCEKWGVDESEADKWEQNMKKWYGMEYEHHYKAI